MGGDNGKEQSSKKSSERGDSNHKRGAPQKMPIWLGYRLNPCDVVW